MFSLAAIPLPQVVQMATTNPARLLKIAGRKESLEPGKDADLCIADESMQVYLTWSGEKLSTASRSSHV